MVVTAFIMKTSAPKVGKPGDIIPISITAKQQSDWLSDNLHGDTFEYRIFQGGTQIQVQQVSLPNEQEVTSTIMVQMPQSELTLNIELWFNELKYISEKKVDETLITIAAGTTTSFPETTDETKVDFWDQVFNGANKTIIMIIVILIIVFVFYYFVIVPRK